MAATTAQRNSHGTAQLRPFEHPLFVYRQGAAAISRSLRHLAFFFSAFPKNIHMFLKNVELCPLFMYACAYSNPISVAADTASTELLTLSFINIF